ncbi:MAG: biotin carboxylase [Rhizobiaceae bacterium]
MVRRRRRTSSQHLSGLPEIRRYFHRNEQPIFFVSPTNFNLLGMDEWCRNFKFISYFDCYDGRHPNVFVPSELPHDEFESIEDINGYLLQHKEVVDLLNACTTKPAIVMLMFDERIERICNDLDVDVWFPKAALRERIDDKIETVRIGDAAGVPSVPNVLSEVISWEQLQSVSNGLGTDLVLQTAFGDSGHTTFFIKSRKDFERVADQIIGKGEVKIMKRIDNRGTAVEACVTSAGTLVGPLMTELVGFSQLTPYRGGWCGNEIFPNAFAEEVRRTCRAYTEQFGEQLGKEGYRGYFELDFLIDKNTNEVYLGECNPRVTGASSMTNHAAFAHADAPLFLFHLLEFSGQSFDLDVGEINNRWADEANIDDWCQMVIKHTDPHADIITGAPQSGIYKLTDQGEVEFDRFDYHRRAVSSENEAFFLRIMSNGDVRYEGGDLGILITRGDAMGRGFGLRKRAKQWIAGMREHYESQPLPADREVRPTSTITKLS